ncbi:MAG: GPP34 family phosphoprotein [Acidimicrobiales bacterium]|nr:GPP34 family phosphoprotein [Acidimicrobiales bacterium]HMS88144.1 GPP34 family phosphoprotein [Acidimicrobiales bacterium]
MLLLLAEELALLAIDPATGRHGSGDRDPLNAALAGLLVAELVIEGRARFVDDASRAERMATTTAGPPSSPALAAAQAVLDDRGPKLKPVLRAMSRGLDQQLGTGTWDTAVAGLVAAGKVSTPAGSVRPRVEVLDIAGRELLLARLRDAAAGEGPLDDRTAALLNATGPARLLELVAPDRAGRRHARRRIDHLLDGTPLGAIGTAVRKVIEEDATAAT